MSLMSLVKLVLAMAATARKSQSSSFSASTTVYASSFSDDGNGWRARIATPGLCLVLRSPLRPIMVQACILKRDPASRAQSVTITEAATQNGPLVRKLASATPWTRRRVG
jgi:hypothetical protein